MKKTIDLAFINSADGPLLVNPRTGERDDSLDSLKDFIRDAFVIGEDEMVAVRVIVNDSEASQSIPYDHDTACAILQGKADGSFLTCDEREVRLFANDIRDEYPLVGAIDGELYRWDEDGVCSTGDDDDSLFIRVSPGKLKVYDHIHGFERPEASAPKTEDKPSEDKSPE